MGAGGTGDIAVATQSSCRFIVGQSWTFFEMCLAEEMRKHILMLILHATADSATV